MEIAEIVSAIDDPELLVASSGIKNFLVHRQHDECRKTNLRVNGNDVGLGVFDGPRAGIRVGRLRPRQYLCASEEKRDEHGEARDSRKHRFLLTEGHSCFSNRLTKYAAGVFLRPLGNERRDAPARRRWPRQLRRTRAREFGGGTLAGKDREIRLRRSLTAPLPGSVPLRFRGDRYDIETGQPVAHRFSPAKTSRPLSKPCFSKASARFRLSNGSFVYSQ